MPISEHVSNTTTALKNPRSEARKYSLRVADKYAQFWDNTWYKNIRHGKDLGEYKDDEIKKAIPHVAVVMDGDRTYAKLRGIEPELAHKLGGEKAISMLRVFRELPIDTVSLWAWSVSNWRRSPKDREMVFDAIKKTLSNEKLQKELMETNGRFRMLGWKTEHVALVGQEDGTTRKESVKLPDDILELCEQLEEMTKENTGQNLVLLADFNRNYEDAQMARHYSDFPLKPGEETQLIDFPKPVFTFPDGFVLQPASIVFRTGEKGPDIHTSGLGRLGDGEANSWEPIGPEFPAHRVKHIMEGLGRRMKAHRKAGK